MISAEFLELDRQIRQCTLCESALVMHPEYPPGRTRGVQARAIVSEPASAKVMLIGQAPGLIEYDTGRPFSGTAGIAVRKFFAECGLPISEFDRIVYQTSAVKCFPGRKLNKTRWEDRPPCAVMLGNCSRFLSRQIEVIQPQIIVAMGVVALKAMDKIRQMPARQLQTVVGTWEKWQGITIVYLAHTSGGSRFLNDPANKEKQAQAKAILSKHLALL